MATVQEDIFSLRRKNQELGGANARLQKTADAGRDSFCGALDEAGKLDSFLDAAIRDAGVEDFYNNTQQTNAQGQSKASGALIEDYLGTSLDHAANDANHRSDRQKVEAHSFSAMQDAHDAQGHGTKKSRMESDLFDYRMQMTDHKMGLMEEGGNPVPKPELSNEWKDQIADTVTQGIQRNDPSIAEALGHDRAAVGHLVERAQAGNKIAVNERQIANNDQTVAVMRERGDTHALQSFAEQGQGPREADRAATLPLEAGGASQEANGPRSASDLLKELAAVIRGEDVHAEESKGQGVDIANKLQQRRGQGAMEPTETTQAEQGNGVQSVAEPSRPGKMAPTINVFDEQAQDRPTRAAGQQAEAAGERGRGRARSEMPQYGDEQMDQMSSWAGQSITPEQHQQFKKGSGSALYERGLADVQESKKQASGMAPQELAAKREAYKAGAPQIKNLLEDMAMGPKLQQQREKKSQMGAGS
jgi:hypothetical protein